MGSIQVIELRFEDYANNNHKFYRTYLWNGGALTQWGRIGTKGQFKLIQASQAHRKAQDKQNSGYVVTTPWTEFEVSGHTMAAVINNAPTGFAELDGAANRAIGTRIAPPAAKSEAEAEKEFADQLLKMAGKLRKPAPEAPATDKGDWHVGPQPREPQVDPNSVEARLGAALASARKKG
jgi:predicted DNA-binding WGR domain protein